MLHDKIYSTGGSSDHTLSFHNKSNKNNSKEPSLCDQYSTTREEHLLSSKLIARNTRKNMQTHQDHNQLIQNNNCSSSSSSNNNSSTSGVIRVCSNCNTSKTPLWRGGPRGPKSLCNACGIRQRKARVAIAAEAAAAAATVSSGVLVTGDKPSELVQRQEIIADRDCTIPYKKRRQFAASSANAKKQLGFDNVVIGMNKNSSVRRIIPQDEEDAAILLLALSCGLIQDQSPDLRSN